MAALQVFADVLRSLKFSPSSPVGVAVSGGCDSVALAHMAKQFFNNKVVAVTIDHQLRPNSRQEALEVKNIVESFELQHKIMAINWPNKELPSIGSLQTECRKQRYDILLSECKRMNLHGLLCGHHADDQIETFFIRLASSSGLNGLACMLPLMRRHDFLSIPIVRPLLSVCKMELKKYCQDNNLRWIEDPSNEDPAFQRNYYRLVLKERPDIKDGVLELINMFGTVRQISNSTISSVLDKMVRINTADGYATIKYSMFSKLPSPTARRLLETVIRYVNSGNWKYVSYVCAKNAYNSIMNKIKTKNSTVVVHGQFNNCFIFHIDNQVFGVAKQRLQKSMYVYTPINIGQTIHWDSRFNISLNHLDPSQNFGGNKNSFYIRNMTTNDEHYASKGKRKVKSIKLPHQYSRGGLPVIVAKEEGMQEKERWPVVLIPHFKYINREYGVKCACDYKEIRNLHSYLDYIPECID